MNYHHRMVSDPVRGLDVEVGAFAEWLADHQPSEPRERPYWYLGVLVGLGRESDAEFTVITIEQALRAGAMSAEESAARLAHLACRVGAESDLPALSADVAARRCIALLGMRRDEAVRLVEQWRDAPREMFETRAGDVRRLRAVKNLLGPVAGLVDRLTDRDLLLEVREWLALRPRMP
jgi:hypothetical protein